MEHLSSIEVIGGLLALILGPGGGTYMAFRMGMNGLRSKISETHSRVEKIDGKLDALSITVNQNRTDVGRLFERSEAHEAWIRRVERAAERIKEERS